MIVLHSYVVTLVGNVGDDILLWLQLGKYIATKYRTLHFICYCFDVLLLKIHYVLTSHPVSCLQLCFYYIINDEGRVELERQWYVSCTTYCWCFYMTTSCEKWSDLNVQDLKWWCPYWGRVNTIYRYYLSNLPVF